jgi:hypothetical protein
MAASVLGVVVFTVSCSGTPPAYVVNIGLPTDPSRANRLGVETCTHLRHAEVSSVEIPAALANFGAVVYGTKAAERVAECFRDVGFAPVTVSPLMRR